MEQAKLYNEKILDNSEFLARLDAAAYDPKESLIVMQSELNVDVGPWLGFVPDFIRDDPDTLRVIQLSVMQYEAIKSFEDVVKVLCKHSSMDTHEVGAWLTVDHKELKYKSPLDILFSSLSEQGLGKNDVKRIADLAWPWIGGDHDANYKLWGSLLD